MDKPADAQFPIHELLRARWSPRAFSDRPVAPSLLRSLWEAARWAPSCFNEQPWAFLVATKDQPEEFAKLLSCLVDANIVWAGQAPVLMISLAKMRFDESHKPNPHAWHDVGLASENLVIQAMTLGLMTHLMAGFSPEKVRTLYAVPEGYEPVAAMALGYPGSADGLPERLRERELAPRTRHPIASFVYGSQWGAPSPLTAE